MIFGEIVLYNIRGLINPPNSEGDLERGLLRTGKWKGNAAGILETKKNNIRIC